LIYQSENFGNDYDFRCRAHKGFLIEAHLHDYSEILYCKSGIADIAINGKPIQLTAHQLILIPPNYVHAYHCKDTEVVCAVFSNDFIPLFFQKIGNKKLISKPIDAGAVIAGPEQLVSLNGAEPIAISGHLNLICAEVLKHATFDESKTMDGILYQKVISYLSEHYTENVTLKSIAAKFGYNEKYLSANLHTLTGIHFSRLLSMYRINHAKKLLVSNNLSMAEIALSSGFSAINTFNRVFKSFTGTTPSRYKHMREQ